MTYIHEIALRPLLNQSQPIANGEEWRGFWKGDDLVALYSPAFRQFLEKQERSATELKHELVLQKILLAGKEGFAKAVRDPSTGKAVKAYVIRVKR